MFYCTLGSYEFTQDTKFNSTSRLRHYRYTYSNYDRMSIVDTVVPTEAVQ